jgi:hypothetical protein
MKLTATLLTILTFGLFANATVITVSNTPNSPAQYTDLQTAINAATTGDTLYVSGSNTNYGSILIDKQLVLIGTGFNPQKEFPFVSSLGDIAIQALTASGSVFYGLFFDSNIGSSNTQVDNIQIRRCKFGYIAVVGSNWLLENNIAGIIDCNNNFNLVINNNIINNNLSVSNQPNLMISNNLFFNSGAGYGLVAISNATIINNIFYAAHPINVTTSIFNNNLTFNTLQDTLPYGTNTGSGNIANQDPQFTTIQTLNYTFSAFDDYRLLPTSPGHNAGADGTDIGPFGGSSPFLSSPIGGEPKIPQVKNMNLSNTTYPLNGNINLNVKGKKQD